MPQLIDLTRPIDTKNRDLVAPELRPLANVFGPKIQFNRPEEIGRERMCAIFGCSGEDLPDGEGWGEEVLSDMNTHCSTHVDAPYHSGNTIEGKPARKIHEIDVQELFCPGMVLDMQPYAKPGEAFTIEELQAAIDTVGRPIEDGDAVMLRTGQERYTMQDPEFWTYPGMSRDGTVFLTGQGARVLGTDAPGWDRPFPVMKRRFEETGDGKVIWDGHFAVREKEAFIVQQLDNLAALPPTGYMVAFFPIRLVGTSAAPARVVAFLD
jgi:kynurenine formamidase